MVLVTIDACRPDHLGLYGYRRPTSPEIDRWFAEGAVYERAYATETSTAPSVVSLLSGLSPQDHGVRLFYQLVPDDVELVPDLLPSDYQTAAFVSNMVLTEEALGIASRFDHFDDFVDERESERVVYERNARRTTDAALEWLSEGRDPERRLFLWVHYIDPHGPYDAPADAPVRFDHEGMRRVSEERIAPPARIEGLKDALEYVDRYDEEIAYTDSHVGRLLAGYAASAAADDTLFVLSSDHGESMVEHERYFTHGYQVYEELIRVPLLVRSPGLAPTRVATPVSTADIAGTVLSWAGVAPPAEWADGDLVHPTELAADRRVWSEATNANRQWRAVVQGEQKRVLAVRGRNRRIVTRWAFDLAEDPAEARRRPWPADDPLGAALETRTMEDPDPSGLPERYREGQRLAGPKVPGGLSEEALDALRALGYVE